MEQQRNGTTEHAAGYWTGATALDGDWQVRLGIGFSDGAGSLDRYMTAQQARELAAALTRAADHYDAETARLAQQVSA